MKVENSATATATIRILKVEKSIFGGNYVQVAVDDKPPYNLHAGDTLTIRLDAHVSTC